MIHAPLAEQLRRDLTYDTPARPPPLANGLPGMPWLRFYPRMLAGFLHCGLLVKRHAIDLELMYRATAFQTRAAEAAGGRLTVRGLEHLAGLKGPAVIVVNHMSTLETVSLPTFILPFTPMSFVLKSSLLKIPIMGNAIRGFEPIVVTRKDARADLRIVLEEGARRLAAGTSVVMFPQTTRALDFDPRRFSSLGVKLARRSGVPLVPCAVRTDFWPPGTWIKDLGSIHPERLICYTFGPPVPVDRGSDREAQSELIAFIAARLREWGVSVLADPPAVSDRAAPAT